MADSGSASRILILSEASRGELRVVSYVRFRQSTCKPDSADVGLDSESGNVSSSTNNSIHYVKVIEDRFSNNLYCTYAVIYSKTLFYL